MRSASSLAEVLILEVLREEAERRDLSSVLLIGMQACSTIQSANEMVGSERVTLLHLDRAAGAVACGLGNQERYLSLEDGETSHGDDPATNAVVAVNVEAAKSYRLLREVVGRTARHVEADGVVLVAGPRKGGAEVAARSLGELFESVELVTYRKGERIYRASRPRPSAEPEPDENAEFVRTEQEPKRPGRPCSQDASQVSEDGGDRIETVVLRGHELRLRLDDRIFARGRLDPATRMLAEVFEVRPGAAVLDLGAGSGVLGIVAALLEPTVQVTLADSDPLAVEVSRQNAAANGALNVTAQLSDVLRDLPGQTFDIVVMNPPFHRGRRQDRSLAERFIAEASGALRPGGVVYLVCNRFLLYERTLEQAVGPVREVAGDRQFKVLFARRSPGR
jgi:16S rRNA G1207 methylase RsmC